MMSIFKKILTTSLTISVIFFATSCGENENTNIQITGVKGPTVTLIQDNVTLSFVFETIELDGGYRYLIPKFPNSYIELSPDLESNGTLMQVSVSVKDVLNEEIGALLDPMTLPGGRNLPGVSGGSLPAVAFSIKKFHNMTFYLGKDIFAVFVPVNVGVDGAIASFRYFIGKKRAGTISLVGKDINGENSGILLMLDMKGQIKNQLENIYNKYN